MNKGTMEERMLNKNDKGMGLIFVLISLLVIFSLILFPIKYNPIYLVEILLMSVVGFAGVLVVALSALILSLHFYLGVKIEWFSKKRIIMMLKSIFLILIFISLIINNVNLEYKINSVMSFKDYYNVVAVDNFMSIWNEDFGTLITLSQSISFTGFILPILLWVLGGFWWNSIITFVIVILGILYSLYVLITDEFTILLSQLAFWVNDSKAITTNIKASGLDLNQSTEEFELNFDSVQETKEKLELIERVRQNMNKKNYEELSTKIADEKQKLIDLRARVLAKVKQNKEEHLATSRVSESQREEIMASLGYTTYSSLKSSIERNQASVEDKEPFRYTKPETYVEEEKIEENVELINDGFQTTEDVYKLDEPTLVDTFVEDMLEGFNPTVEAPININYEEIFDNEEAWIEQIDKTLETIIEIEEQIEEKIRTAEVVIEGLDQEVTVEEYLSIPDTIAKSEELKLNLNQTNIILEQQNDHTVDSEFTSIQPEEVSEAAIRFIEDVSPTSPNINNTEVQVQQIVEQVVEVTQQPTQTFTPVDEPTQFVAQPTPVINSPETEETGIKFEFTPEETKEDELEVEEPKKYLADWCKPYILPSTSILSSQAVSFDNSILVQEANAKAMNLNTTFDSFGVKAQVHSFEIGPTITTFKVVIEPGIKTTKVTNLEDNIKLTLGAEYIRIIAPIPGTSFIGIEIPNSTKRPVLFKTVYDETPSSDEGIIISIGQDVSGKSLSFDLTKAPHLLVAGSTGSGKSVAINTILASILLRYKPTDVQLVLVDPKMVEFAPFHGVPHLMAEVITDAQNANNALKAMVEEMENRYRQMASMGVKKLEELNAKLISQGENKLPYLVVVIDELADLMMVAAKEVEDSIMRITQKARAAGIHMILATQRPSTEIITGTIKSNIPSRMAFTVASSIDSRTILGQVGAEKLIGNGDMLVSLYGQLPFRGQGAYISNEEVDDITAFTKSQCEANYQIDVNSLLDMTGSAHGSLVSTSDPLYVAAKDTVIHYQKASTSMLQRHLNIGYNKAANIIETLEDEGIIGPAKGSKPREVLK